MSYAVVNVAMLLCCVAEAAHCSVTPILSLTQPLVATLEQDNLLNWYPCCVV